MALAHTRLRLVEPAKSEDRSLTTNCGEAGSRVGDAELSVGGAPDALRRLAAALVVAADAAETLRDPSGHPTAASVPEAG
jgi:hypothetical protein